MPGWKPGKPGRPPKAVVEKRERSLKPEKAEPLIDDLVDRPQYFEREMQQFFIRGQIRLLRRWFVAYPDNAEQIAVLMVLRFRDKLGAMLDGLPRKEKTNEVSD